MAQSRILGHLYRDVPLQHNSVLTPTRGIPHKLDTNTKYLLTPGEYTTTGIALPEGGKFQFIIEDTANTLIKFRPGPAAHPHRSLFTCNSYVLEGLFDGLRVDLGWDEFAAHREMFGDNFKLTLFGEVKFWEGKTVDFDISRGGASGSTAGIWNEAFIVRMDTFRGERLGEGLPVPCVEIANGRIHSCHFSPGAYGTLCFSQTNQGTDNGDREPIGTRTSIAAHIHDVEIDAPDAIALGCGGAGAGRGSEQVLFENIKVTDATCALNFDTGSAYNITVRDSEFHCAAGINLVGANNTVSILDNTFVIGGPYRNRILHRDEPQYAVRVKNNMNTLVKGNTVYSDLEVNMVGSYIGDNKFFTKARYRKPQPTLEIIETEALSELKAKLAKLEFQLTAKEATITTLTDEVRTVEAEASAYLMARDVALKDLSRVTAAHAVLGKHLRDIKHAFDIIAGVPGE
jgi:hypothetical protein